MLVNILKNQLLIGKVLTKQILYTLTNKIISNIVINCCNNRNLHFLNSLINSSGEVKNLKFLIISSSLQSHQFIPSKSATTLSGNLFLICFAGLPAKTA